MDPLMNVCEILRMEMWQWYWYKITNRSYGTEQIHFLFSIEELFLWNRDSKKSIENLHYNKNIIYVLHHLYTRCSSGTKIRKKSIENLHYNKNIIHVLHHLHTRCSSGIKIRKIIPIENLHYNKKYNFCVASCHFILMGFIVPGEQLVYNKCVKYWCAFHRNAWWIR